MAIFCKKTQLMLEFLKGPFLSLLFSYSTLTTINNIAVYADDTIIYSKCDQETNLRLQQNLASELEFNLWTPQIWGRS